MAGATGGLSHYPLATSYSLACLETVKAKFCFPRLSRDEGWCDPILANKPWSAGGRGYSRELLLSLSASDAKVMSAATTARPHEDKSPHSEKGEQNDSESPGPDGITAQLCHLESHHNFLHWGNQTLSCQLSVLEGDHIPNLYMLIRRGGEKGRGEDRGKEKLLEQGQAALSP